ncbi:MAG: GGDEF domain-containing protein, partial [Rhodobacterales bacterium]
GLRAAVTDPLTGLYNRRYALPHLTRMTEQASRSGRRFAVMLADLDHFKAINDRFGHAAGDAVLVEVAHRLRSNLRAVDLVARIGGEEFLIALPDTDRTEARVAARRLCRIIAQDPFILPGKGQSTSMTVSIGVTMGHSGQPPERVIDPDCDIAADPVQQLLLQADKALYGAKACGRNQVTLSKPAA